MSKKFDGGDSPITNLGDVRAKKEADRLKAEEERARRFEEGKLLREAQDVKGDSSAEQDRQLMFGQKILDAVGKVSPKTIQEMLGALTLSEYRSAVLHNCISIALKYVSIDEAKALAALEKIPGARDPSSYEIAVALARSGNVEEAKQYAQGILSSILRTKAEQEIAAANSENKK